MLVFQATVTIALYVVMDITNIAASVKFVEGARSMHMILKYDVYLEVQKTS